MKIPIEQIKPSPEPVRTQMEPSRLDELAQSIRERGLIVPIKVRPDDDMYEVIYGHRRLAAAKMVGMDEIECIVEGKEKDDALVEALIENVQREDMNDADVRDALREIKERTGKTWKEVGSMFGWSMKHTQELASITDREADIIKSSPERITQTHVEKSRTAGDDSVKVLEKAEKEELSTRQVEQVAKSVAATKDPKRKQYLIETPYSPFIHDPDMNRERADKYGASDPTSFSKEKTPTEEWKELPETKLALKYLKDSQGYADKIIMMFEEGKFAPEAKLFVIGKIKKVIEKWQDAIEEIENV